nr:MAG TPA: hypothetical protein [Caudoviricetes sp.]
MWRFKSSRADQKSSKNRTLRLVILCLFSVQGNSGGLLG